MKTMYKGFELEARREKCLAGYDLLYYTVFKDGYEWNSGFEYSDETISNKIKELKNDVDHLIECLTNYKCPICENKLLENYYCGECDDYFDEITI